MPKRKASQLEAGPDDNDNNNSTNLRRSTRRKPLAPQQEDAGSAAAAAAAAAKSTTRRKEPESPKEKEKKKKSAKKETAKTPSKKPQAKTTKSAAAPKSGLDEGIYKAAGLSDKSYWLMKAEPESRFENGTDVKFSIDDLASRTEPEPWDGIRAYAARNNLRSMKKGELAFFYHSNCKEPGIVGTMEIVEEHSPDLSAHDPKAPYYDASSKPEDPKWSVVHVKFRSKFAQPIGLKELREMGKPGQPLENMQLLKQSRLSVSRVSPAEWEYLMSVFKQRGGETQ
ncbi:DUF55-domain-containing protein [Biscogniauxia marginata]|nr:DUF55-domain-containing protein [Biscogniauxia marginata]